MINIDEKKLRELIESLYNVTGIKVAVFDTEFKEVLAYPEDDCSFCALMHSDEAGSLACSKSNADLCKKCATKKALIIETCHAGLTEVVAPLSNDNSIIGYIMFGQITNAKDRDLFKENVLTQCKKYELDRSQLKEVIDAVKFYSDKQLLDSSRIVDALASYIIFSRLAFETEQPIILSIIDYISTHLSADLTVTTLCKKFFISKTELYKIGRAYMPDGVAVFVKNKRMNHAADLLLHTDKSLAQISEEVGFADVGYFQKVFKQVKGISPVQYRNSGK